MGRKREYKNVNIEFLVEQATNKMEAAMLSWMLAITLLSVCLIAITIISVSLIEKYF